MTDSPLNKWLKKNGMTQGQFAVFAGVDRAAVCRFAAGDPKPPRKLRNYLNEKYPQLLNEHCMWVEDRMAALAESLEAA